MSVRRSRGAGSWDVWAAGDFPVVSIVAPPGYGKTTLLAQWATDGPRQAAWLTIDAFDNDPVVFLGYLAAALDRIEALDSSVFRAVALERGHALCHRPPPIGHSGFAAPVLVALDDAHRLTDRASLDALAEFMTYLPRDSQVALASRDPVGLPLPRWRAEGSTLLEIGPADLAMDDREAEALARRLGVRLPDDVIGRLARHTGGWPALLALAARAAQEPARVDVPLSPNGNPAISDYLRAELLEGRSEDEIDTPDAHLDP